jgi:pilus assembly protein CpaF
MDDPRSARSTAREREIFNKLHQRVLNSVDLSVLATLDDAHARNELRELASNFLSEEEIPLSVQERRSLVKRLEDEILGLGPLEPLLADHSVSDILVNGAHQVYVERHGRLEQSSATFFNDEHLLRIIDRIVSTVGRRIDESSPMVDARLQDGSRVNAIIPPLALDGPLLSIRRFAVRPLGIDDLINMGTLTEDTAKLLDAIVKARLNVVISGGTGSGKTTTLNVLSGFIPASERVVTIEDSAELQFQHAHAVRLETRPPNVEGRGEVTQRDLVRNSLRMRPDRIVIGEVRGAEALDMLQAMNTGHDGSLTTIHANSARDALGRVENMVTMTGFDMPVKAIRAQIASAVNVVVQVERLGDGRRRVTSIQEVVGMEGDIITMTELFKFERMGIDDENNFIGEFKPTGIVPAFMERFAQRGLDVDIKMFNPVSSPVSEGSAVKWIR